MMASNTSGKDRAGSDVPAAATLSYADASAELDAIIEEFEGGLVDVDRLVVRLERATAIVDELDHRLRRTRMQVEELVPRLEAIGRGDIDDSPGEGDGDGHKDVGAGAGSKAQRRDRAPAAEMVVDGSTPDQGSTSGGSEPGGAPQGLF